MSSLSFLAEMWFRMLKAVTTTLSLKDYYTVQWSRLPTSTGPVRRNEDHAAYMDL